MKYLLVLCFAAISFAASPPAEKTQATETRPSGPTAEPTVDTFGLWSLEPVQNPKAPALKSNWIKNDIDRFIFDQLSQRQQTPSIMTDRRTLARRISLVMHGLIPTPEQVDAFVNDQAPDAYEKLVDRILQSQHYGERWAQHWLDTVRYAETTGYEINGANGNITPYRDYVIRALNEDKPYDQFLMEQIAGDHFKQDAATAFLVAGPHDVNRSPDPKLTAMQKYDGLDEMIKATSATMLGLTVGCARCHDHKFDPISQKDYYAMQAVFAGVAYGSRKAHGAENDKMQQEAAAMKPKVEALREQLESLHVETKLGPPVDYREYLERFDSVLADGVKFTINAANNNGPVELDDVMVFITPSDEKPSYNIASRDEGATATSSPTAVGNQGKSADLLLDEERQLLLFFRSKDKSDVWFEISFSKAVNINRVMIRPRGSAVPVDYRIEVRTPDGDYKQVIDSRDRFISRGDEREVDQVEFNGVDKHTTERIVELNKQLRELEQEYNKLVAGPQVFAGKFNQPEKVFLLTRGDPFQPSDEVAPNIPAVLGDLALKPDATEADRRLALAKGIASKANPLTARVIVNRVWQHCFGTGIVDTPSDFGVNGSSPTHPQLLDHLASYLMDHDWSLKSLHRYILLSATFRQASHARPQLLEKDSDTRFLWRFPPRRMEAESLRDSILVASGKMNKQMYGNPFKLFEDATSSFMKKVPLEEFDKDGWRRMIYAEKIRLEQIDIFGVFDCPDASQLVAKRSRSTTAVQALSLFNSKFINRQAQFMADLCAAASPGDPDKQVQHAVQRTYGREADAEEMDVLMDITHKLGLATTCRILINSNEFVFIN